MILVFYHVGWAVIWRKLPIMWCDMAIVGFYLGRFRRFWDDRR